MAKKSILALMCIALAFNSFAAYSQEASNEIRLKEALAGSLGAFVASTLMYTLISSGVDPLPSLLFAPPSGALVGVFYSAMILEAPGNVFLAFVFSIVSGTLSILIFFIWALNCWAESNQSGYAGDFVCFLLPLTVSSILIGFATAMGYNL